MSGSWVLDVYAALACLEYPEPRVLETDAQRQAWVRRVNKLKFPIELICSEDSVRGYQDRSKTIACVVRARWNRIFSLSLFMEHFETCQREITSLVLKHGRLLNQALENNSDLKSQQPFELSFCPVVLTVSRRPTRSRLSALQAHLLCRMHPKVLGPLSDVCLSPL
ncbi:E3 ubiquitin-protein ligase rnf213-alpha-like isoform X2 [Vanacampus margaritifer]